MSINEIDIGKFSEVCYAGGSTHILKTCKLEGDRFYLKFPDTGLLYKQTSDPTLQVLIEYLSYQIYSLYPGVKLPEKIHLVSDPTKKMVGIATSEIKRETHKSVPLETIAQSMSAGVFVDIFLANWDIANLENVIPGKHNKAYRIDPGGTLMFRARGQRKQFGGKPGELQTMLDPEFPGGAGYIFEHADIIEAAKTFLSVGWQTIESKIKKTSQYILGVLEEANLSQNIWNNKEIADVVNVLRQRYQEIVNHSKFVLLQQSFLEVIIKEEVTKALMSKMGYSYVGKNYRVGSDTYIQKDDTNSRRSRAIAKDVNRNIQKSKTANKRLHDPSAMGISLPKHKRG